MKLIVVVCVLITTLPWFSGADVGSMITPRLFGEMLKHRDSCGTGQFYTYNAFITAASSCPEFGTTGDDVTRKRELAAFFAQTSHETNGGWPTAPDGPYAWGYCFRREQGDIATLPNYYDASWPCPDGKKYFGRGPIQLSYNYNYAHAGKAIGVDLINSPQLVATDPVISFKTAIWFWMTPQANKPSCHDVMVNRWTPSPSDRAAGRVPGLGVITNIINGGVECGKGPNPQMGNRIGFYKRYCDMLGVRYGPNLNCDHQQHFG